MGLTADGEPTCGCGDPLCDTGNDDAYWARDPNRANLPEPPPPQGSCARGADLRVTSAPLVEAFDDWCQEFAWSPTGLAT